MRVFCDNRQLLHAPQRELHNGDWAPHAESPDRLASILDQCPAEPAQDFGIAPILAVHDPAYVEFLRDAFTQWHTAGRSGDALGYAFPIVGRRRLALDRIEARLGHYAFDASTPIAAGTWQSAYWSAQSALSALQAMEQGVRHSFALCRPPGHHAGRDYMGGYCYLNNAAIAARRATDLGLGPVAILDVDYHHGNGTQDIFAGDPAVFFASLHADPVTDYPFFWGHADERGEGDGEGATLNLPLPQGTKWSGYSTALDHALGAISQWGAKFLVVSLGADTFIGDPISHFDLVTEDYRKLSAQIATLGLPALIVMEGGYAVDDLGRNVLEFLAGFD